jgi:putative ABC transport system substrate-binding protein
MRRREFIGVLTGAVTCPAPLRAQQARVPVVGLLGILSPPTMGRQLTALRQRLRELGLIEGQNIAIDYRWAEGRYTRLPQLAADLARRPVDVLVAIANAGALAAQRATKTIPIVFMIGGDPVRLGLVPSINRPDGNLTGVIQMSDLLIQKRFELAHELVPTARTIAALVNPNNPEVMARINDLQEAATATNLKIEIFRASDNREIDIAFRQIAERMLTVVLIQNDPFFNFQHHEIILQASRRKLPAVFEQRGFAEAGGLIAYGTSISEMYRQVGEYVGKILNGSKIIDLPVVRPTKFELAINLKTARALGLIVSPTLLARADEVIE